MNNRKTDLFFSDIETRKKDVQPWRKQYFIGAYVFLLDRWEKAIENDGFQGGCSQTETRRKTIFRVLSSKIHKLLN